MQPQNPNLAPNPEQPLQAPEAAPAPVAPEAAPQAPAAAPVAPLPAPVDPLPAAPVIDPAVAPQYPAAVVTPSVTPAIADDVDVIEKEWVDQANKVIDQTKDDPFVEEEAVEALQQDYLKKRYGHEVKKPDEL